MISKTEKFFVSVFTSVFVFLGYALEAANGHEVAYANHGWVAFSPYSIVCFVTLGSVYYHLRETFEDHMRLIISCAGLPAFLAGLQGIYSVAL